MQDREKAVRRESTVKAGWGGEGEWGKEYGFSAITGWEPILDPWRSLRGWTFGDLGGGVVRSLRLSPVLRAGVGSKILQDLPIGTEGSSRGCTMPLSASHRGRTVRDPIKSSLMVGGSLGLGLLGLRTEKSPLLSWIQGWFPMVSSASKLETICGGKRLGRVGLAWSGGMSTGIQKCPILGTFVAQVSRYGHFFWPNLGKKSPVWQTRFLENSSV